MESSCRHCMVSAKGERQDSYVIWIVAESGQRGLFEGHLNSGGIWGIASSPWGHLDSGNIWAVGASGRW